MGGCNTCMPDEARRRRVRVNVSDKEASGTGERNRGACDRLSFQTPWAPLLQQQEVRHTMRSVGVCHLRPLAAADSTAVPAVPAGAAAATGREEGVAQGAKRGVRDAGVVASTPFADGRYGTCQTCGGPIAIPGLAHWLCPRCGWVARRANTHTVGPRSHHE